MKLNEMKNINSATRFKVVHVSLHALMHDNHSVHGEFNFLKQVYKLMFFFLKFFLKQLFEPQ